MRAITVREYGGTPAVAEIPTPEPGARQILITLGTSVGWLPPGPTIRSGGPGSGSS
jgi:NADPH:quinone reductase-like Zn-dependent oxidoreductase